MFLTLIILALIVSVLLVLVVLAQNPKGGGLNTQFGGGGASQLMGVQRTGDLLERLSWILAVALMVISLAAYVVHGSGAQAVQARSVNVEKAKQDPAPSPTPTAPMTAPGAQAPAGATELPAADGAAAPAAEATPAPAGETTPPPAQ
jgi:preprotein translocase subunit SecG